MTETLTCSLLALFLSAPCSSAEEVDAQKISAVLHALSQQYKSFDVEYQRKGYEIHDGVEDERPTDIGDIIYRSNGTSTFYSFTGTSQPPDVEGRQPDLVHKKYSSSPGIIKRLRSTGEGQPHRGTVTRDYALKDELYACPINMMFAVCDDYDRSELAERILEIEARDELYHVRIERSARRQAYLSLVLDSSKAFTPTKYEYVHKGQVTYAMGFDDYRRLPSGLWLPMKSEAVFPGESRIAFEMKKVVLSGDLLEKDLDFEFPLGTIVSDKIADVRYIVGQGGPESNPVDDPSLRSSQLARDMGDTRVPEGEIVGSVADEKQLQNVQNEAKKLVLATEETSYSKLLYVAVPVAAILPFLLHIRFRRRQHA